MSNLLKGFCLLALVLNTQVYANVQANLPARHWYLSSFLGTQFNATGKTKIPSIDASRPPLTSQPVYDKGYALNLSVGYEFHHAFRLESEFKYQNLPMKKIIDAIGPNTVTNVKNSNTQLFSVFLNSYYDFHLSQHWMTYLGAGVGYVKINNTIKPNPAIPVQNLFFTRKELNYNSFGYQGIIGIAYKLKHHFLIALAYNYFSTISKKTRGKTNLGPDGVITKQRVATNNIFVGVSYFFM